MPSGRTPTATLRNQWTSMHSPRSWKRSSPSGYRRPLRHTRNIMVDGTFQVLLVEDSPTDVLLTREALENATMLNTLHVADNGVEAMEFLRRKGKYSAAPRPDLILLDLNMPCKNGQ